MPIGRIRSWRRVLQRLQQSCVKPQSPGATPIKPGLNCAIDQFRTTPTCRYNRVAYGDEQGDILYKNLNHDLATACGQLESEACKRFETKFGMCTWQKYEEDPSRGVCVEGKNTNPLSLLPLCLSGGTEYISLDCAEENEGAYCRHPDSEIKLVGTCQNGDCKIFAAD